ncbi:hypothetical protein DPI68_RS22295, partial [Escherichia coli]
MFFLSKLMILSMHASFFTIINTKTTLSQLSLYIRKKVKQSIHNSNNNRNNQEKQKKKNKKPIREA